MKKMIASLMCLLLFTNVAFAGTPLDDKNIFNNIHDAVRANAANAVNNADQLNPLQQQHGEINDDMPFWQRLFMPVVLLVFYWVLFDEC